MRDDYKERLEQMDPMCLIHEYGVPGAVRFAVARCKELEHQHSLERIRLKAAKQRNVNTVELSKRIAAVLLDALRRYRECGELIEARPRAIEDLVTIALSRLNVIIIPYEPRDE